MCELLIVGSCFAPGADLGAGVNPVYEISMPSGSVPDARK